MSGQVQPRHHLLPGFRVTPVDPVEPWEIPLPRRGGDEFDCRVSDRPFRPTTIEDIPFGALPALEAMRRAFGSAVQWA